MNEERGKTMNTKKVMSIVTATSMLVLSVSGCSLLGGKDRQAIEDAATGYIDAVNAGKFNKSLKFVEDEEDFFQENEIPSDQADLIAAVMGASEITVENIEAKKDQGSADIVFTMPDLDEIADEGYSLDEFIDAIEDIEGTVEETVEFSFVKDGEDWLIEADSTEEYYNFLMSIGEGIEFSGLSETAALETVDTLVNLLREGDLQGVAAICGETEELDFSDLEEEGMDVNSIINVFSAYYTGLDYTSEVTEVTEDAITVSLTGTAPDAQTAIEETFSDPDTVAPLLADVYESYLNGDNGDMSAAYSSVYSLIGESIVSADTIPYSSSVVVTADEEGNLFAEPADDFIFDFDSIDIGTMLSSDEAVMAAFDLLLEQGRISQSDYDMYTAAYGGGSSTTVTSSSGITLEVLETGSDFYLSDYSITNDDVEILVRTMAYYNTGDTFTYDLTVNGEEYASGATFEMDDDMDDRIEIEIPYENSPAGVYDLTVYDYEATTVLAHIVLTVADSVGEAPETASFGTSMSYDNTGSDFYTFHFYDVSGNALDGASEYSSTDGTVRFTVRTWDYYDEGDVVTCAVYRDGAYVESIESVSEDDSNDTFPFVYEPDGGVEPGDYTFIISDVNSPATLVIAYATVEPA